MRAAILLLLCACASDAPRPAPPTPQKPAQTRPIPPGTAAAATAAATRAETMLGAGRSEDAARAALEGLEALSEVAVEGEIARARMARVLAATGAVEEAQIHAGRALVKLERLEEGTVIPPLRGAIAAAMGAVGQEGLAEKVASMLDPANRAQAWRSAADALRARGAAELAERAYARATAAEAAAPVPRSGETGGGEVPAAPTAGPSEAPPQVAPEAPQTPVIEGK